MPDTTNRTTMGTETSLVLAELETGGYAVSLNGFWIPGSFPTKAAAEFAAGATIARAEPSFSELIHQAADVRETLFQAAKSDRTLDNEMRFECGRAVGIIGKLAARLMAEVNAPPAPPVKADELLAIIGTWLARDCDWGEFEKALDALVEAHS